MAYEAAIIRTGEAPIGDQGSGQCQAAAIEIFHGLIHFPHTRATLRPLVTDHNHMPFMHFACQNSLFSIFLAVEADGFALKVM